jgi:hypothetical protein
VSKGDRFEDVDCGVFSVVRVSEGALLLEPADGDEVWIPKSQLRGDDITEESEAGYSGVLVVPRWLAEKEGLC